MYNIISVNNDDQETIIDQARNKAEAATLVDKYEAMLGDEWIIYFDKIEEEE